MTRFGLYKSNNKSLLLGFIAVCGSFMASTANCLAINLTDTIQIHGFASQTLIRTSKNNFFGDSDSGGGSLDFREIGLNGSMQITADLHLFGQLISRRAGQNDDGDIQLDYGVIDYNFYSQANSRASLRLGRIKVPYGFYNETRDVPVTRPSVFLPQSIYFERSRNLTLSADSLLLASAYRTNAGEISFEFGGGSPNVDDTNIEHAILGKDLPGKLREDISYSGRIQYQQNNEQYRVSLTHSQLNIKYKQAGQANKYGPGKIKFTPWIASLQINDEFWSITMEYARRKFNRNGFNDTGLDRITTGESYYIQGRYRLLKNLEAIFRYDVLYHDIKDRSGTKNALDSSKPRHSFFAKDWTLGLSWSINRYIQLRSEIHFIDGTGWLPQSDNSDANETQRRWRLFALSATYSF